MPKLRNLGLSHDKYLQSFQQRSYEISNDERSPVTFVCLLLGHFDTVLFAVRRFVVRDYKSVSCGKT